MGFMDFLAGYTNVNNNTKIFNNGVCGFLPTVNSDKSQIDSLVCNLKAQATRTNKTYQDLTADEILLEIETEIGEAYRKSLRNVIYDLRRAFNRRLSLGNDSLDSYSVEQLEAIGNSYLNSFNNLARTSGLKPKELLDQVLTEYNTTHRDAPIALA
ncbi:MAG: hypothetical protein HUJ56_11090 [Erysipelotrichaceae bacterium]|nr:hypothetical protein [Erysipelotrichaceae bacterium]